MKEKLAVFDVDGTLFDGNLGIEYIRSLVQKEVFSKDMGDGVFGWYKKYKNGELEKSVAVDEIYKIYAQGMKGLATERASEIAKETWLTVKDNLYSFAEDAIQSLTANGYKVLLLSGSPIEIIRQLGEFLNIDSQNMIAGTLEIVGGIYSGNIVSYPGSSEQKIEELDKLIERRNLKIDWENSLGMGDNERDIGILGRVGHPIAINPNDKLTTMAEKDGWIIARVDIMPEIIRDIVEHQQPTVAQKGF